MEEFYEEAVDYTRDKEISEEDEDDDEIVYDENKVYGDDYVYDSISGKKQKVLSKLNKTKVSKQEMDELLNANGYE